MSDDQFKMDKELFSEFKEEAFEALSVAENSLIAVDRGANLKDHFNNIFRAFHSIKAGARIFGLDNLSESMHYIESLFDKERSAQSLNPRLVDYMLKGIDYCRECFNGSQSAFPSFTDAPAESCPIGKKPSSPSSDRTPLGQIVVVDDEVDILSILNAAFSHHNLNVKSFTEPEKALEQIENISPDLILLDYNMVGMNGIQLLEKIRQKKIECPVIFLSGHLTADVCIQGLNLGAFGFIEKGGELSAVVKTVLNALRAHQATKTIDTCIKFIMYQFPEVEEYLNSSGRRNISIYLKDEFQKILGQRALLKSMNKINFDLNPHKKGAA